MRKYFSCYLIMFFAFLINIYGQNNSSPIIGYNNMVWGTTINEFLRLYPNAKEDISGDADIGVREFDEITNGGDIQRRRFWFYQNQLFRVMVYYGQQNEDIVNALKLRIISIYGNFDDIEEEKEIVRTPYVGYRKSTLFYRYYKNDLTIFIGTNEHFDSRNVLLLSSISCYYQNPIIIKITTDERRRVDREKIRL